MLSPGLLLALYKAPWIPTYTLDLCIHSEEETNFIKKIPINPCLNYATKVVWFFSLYQKNDIKTFMEF